MAEIAFRPDEKIAALEAQARTEGDPRVLANIREQIAARQQEIKNAGNMPAIGFGGQGYYAPQLNVYSATDVQNRTQYERQEALKRELAGKIQLLPQGEPGVYRAVQYNADGTTTDISSTGGNNLTFYDAQGNPLSAAQIANTKTGQSYANAGWNIGFGAGVLPAGTNIISTSTKTSNNAIGNVSTGTLTTSDIETKARRTAQQDFKAALGELGLADLADEVDRMIREDYTVSQIKIELPKTASYQTRFPGMEALRKAGRAISEATYIANERGYLQTLRAYGLDTAILGSRSELGKYISNEVSPREFEERVNLAATRVQENPDVIATFKSYYPEADQSGVITYLLNPKAGMDVIKKQVRVSEIGAAATRAGFIQQIGAEYAGTLVGAVGESTYAQISNEFQRARQLANSQRRLAQIENQAYSDLEAVSAVVGDEVNAALASERRAAREVARFGTRGGITGTSLGTAAQI